MIIICVIREICGVIPNFFIDNKIAVDYETLLLDVKFYILHFISFILDNYKFVSSCSFFARTATDLSACQTRIRSAIIACFTKYIIEKV